MKVKTATFAFLMSGATLLSSCGTKVDSRFVGEWISVANPSDPDTKCYFPDGTYTTYPSKRDSTTRPMMFGRWEKKDDKTLIETPLSITQNKDGYPLPPYPDEAWETVPASTGESFPRDVKFRSVTATTLALEFVGDKTIDYERTGQPIPTKSAIDLDVERRTAELFKK